MVWTAPKDWIPATLTSSELDSQLSGNMLHLGVHTHDGTSGNGAQNILGNLKGVANRLWYSDATGLLVPIVLGANGQVLRFNGATAAPSAGGLEGLAATANRLLYSDNGGVLAGAALGAAGQIVRSSGPTGALAFSSIAGVAATANRDLYSSSGGVVAEIALGAAGTIKRSTGPTSAPEYVDPTTALFTLVDYVWMPDAGLSETIVAGNQQGFVLHSGPVAETALQLFVDAETAPGAAGLPITVQFGSSNDLDSVSWTTIATYTLSSEMSNSTLTMTNATIPANRLLRMNVGTIVGTPKDVTVTLRVKRPVSV